MQTRILATLIPTVLAFAATSAIAEPEKAATPAAENATPAATPQSPADAAWAGVETLLAGPKERPTTREEAMKMFGEFLAKTDEAVASFEKSFPTDPRRWKLVLFRAKTVPIRETLKIKGISMEELLQQLDAAAADTSDADAATKAEASYYGVLTQREKPEDFKKRADAHIAKFPDFKGNTQLTSQLKRAETEAKLKTEPFSMKFTAVDGREVDVEAMRGKVILIDFWATWCGPCIGEIPNVVAAYKKLHDKGFEIIGISFDQDKDKLVSLTKEKEMTWPQFFDGKGWGNEFGKKYGISGIPTMWLINKQGMVVDTSARGGLAEKVEKLLAE
jgi:thiol-disulfide isomerase/thioredoxin